MELAEARKKIEYLSSLFKEINMLKALSSSIKKCKEQGLVTDDVIFNNINARIANILIKFDDLLK